MQEEKKFLLNEVRERLDPAKGFVALRYQNIKANMLADFRKALFDQGGRFCVVKKRIFFKAAEEAGCPAKFSHLEGHLAFIQAEDDFLETVKVLSNFGKENKDAIEVLAGHFENKPLSPEEVELLSTLPNLNEMRAQIIGLLEAPISQTLATFESLLTSVIHCLENKAEKQSTN